jgi:uncharacterized protein YcgI (DUF1989 family)
MAVPQGLRTGRARRALIDMEEGMRLVEKFIVPKATGKGFIVKKGQLLRISNPEGPQVVDFDAFNADNSKEYLSSSVTRREEGIHVTTGSKLYAGPPLERHMFTIVADTVDHKPCPSGARSHDFVMGRCSQVRRRQRYGKDTPGCQEILAAAIKPFGLTEDAVHDPFNIFMKTGVHSDGMTFWEHSDAVKGDYIDLVAEMNCIVAISACPGESSGLGAFPVGVEIYDR